MESTRVHKVVRKSLVDMLATRLSEKTGTEFEVVRRRKVYATVGFQETVITRYFLSAARDGASWTYGGGEGFTVDQMKHYLASLLDMIEMGFIPIEAAALRARRLARGEHDVARG